jgi:hypothetical protein
MMKREAEREWMGGGAAEGYLNYSWILNIMQVGV